AGREHTVLTGVTLHGEPRGRLETAVEASRVRLARMSPREIDWYVATGEPLDKAGSYAVQGGGALFVEAIYGNYPNVVGLPLPATCRLFSALGYDWRWFAAAPAGDRQEAVRHEGRRREGEIRLARGGRPRPPPGVAPPAPSSGLHRRRGADA